MATARIKASDRTKVCQQIVTVLKKHYGGKVPTLTYDVLDTLLFAVCLENNTFALAQEALQKIKEDFFDYNEVRVSSITELQEVFAGQPQPERKALRVRETLQYVFEGRYSYEMEEIKKKNQELAEKQLKKIASLTPFVINHTLLHTLGAHVVPVDEAMLTAGIWLGLLEEESDEEQAADHLKAAVRKVDVPLFYHLFNQLANDEAFADHFAQPQNPHRSENPFDALMASGDLLKQLLSGQIVAEKVKPAKKKASAESDDKDAASKKSALAKAVKEEKAAKDDKDGAAKKPLKEAEKKKKSAEPAVSEASKKPVSKKKDEADSASLKKKPKPTKK